MFGIAPRRCPVPPPSLSVLDGTTRPHRRDAFFSSSPSSIHPYPAPPSSRHSAIPRAASFGRRSNAATRSSRALPSPPPTPATATRPRPLDIQRVNLFVASYGRLLAPHCV
ncbi:hypothetical protein GUJ93_ZPchr0002g24865 [Zizania palustris]|uniref:Uncharacterized protein n=1 Tax=Zizania palustris TaxID=103762 RepID=A0A8J5VHU6_ZIZPA|nr:hypothetical protein GUJ93_ZPchr0002g24865 [Zizania palustris]